jgi:plastocyanin
VDETMSFQRTIIALGSVLLLAACSKQDARADTSAATPETAAAPATPGAPLTPAAGGRVIEVKMMTDEQGNNRYDPSTIEAKQGDVLRYTLVSGVHNVNFTVDKNVGKSGLPGPSALLQAPGQTYDIAVSFDPGEYTFQCDPHAALGMTGQLTVK